MTELVDRHNAILRRRATDATWAVLWAIGSAELLFASFALGASLGPAPLRPIEVILGSTAFFAGGAVAALWLAKRRREQGSMMTARVREGRKEHRVVVFEGYLTIGHEVIVREAITSIELDERGLVLRYRDPRYDGAVLRELTGERKVLEELVSAAGRDRSRSGSGRL